MTGAPLLQILGPYRVGAAPTPHRRDADQLCPLRHRAAAERAGVSRLRALVHCRHAEAARGRCRRRDPGRRLAGARVTLDERAGAVAAPLAAARRHPRAGRRAHAAHRRDCRQAPGRGRQADRGGGAARRALVTVGLLLAQQAQVPAARADEGEHVHLDVRVLRRLLVDLRLAAGARARAVAIYIHEMGHVAMLRRLGIDAGAPLFIPGVGAFVMLKQHVDRSADRREDRAGRSGVGPRRGACRLRRVRRHARADLARDRAADRVPQSLQSDPGLAARRIARLPRARAMGAVDRSSPRSPSRCC